MQIDERRTLVPHHRLGMGEICYIVAVVERDHQLTPL